MKEMQPISGTPKERAETIFQNAYVPLQRLNPSRCIDDRIWAQIDYDKFPPNIVRPNNYLGPQLLGGAFSIFDVALETAPKTLNFDFDLIYNVTEQAFRKANCVMGIHMHDAHGHTSQDELLSKISQVNDGKLVALEGCGADGLAHDLSNPFGFSERTIEFQSEHPMRAAEFVMRGTKLEILGMEHEKVNPLAVVNTQKNLTLNGQLAHQLGQPTYSTDLSLVEELFGGLVIAVGEVDHEWGRNVDERAIPLYIEWLRIADNKLAGMDPIHN